MANISHFTQTVNGVSTTYDIHDANAVPRSGTNALAGSIVPDTDSVYNFGNSSHNFKTVYAKEIQYGLNTGVLFLGGGAGANIELYGKNNSPYAGLASIKAVNNNEQRQMILKPDGTWTWNGTACQITSDQRYKQQISEIDDKLLDAWEDVNLVQFKYNDAVDQKKDKARLHTGYVVQQIDSACKSHGVDVSAYGLYCHEEYPQETEEVEVEQTDGTKTKERKVIREASEHYSLRYTEVYAVECAYLRRENARLKQQMQQYTESLSKLEERLKALEQTSK